MPSLRYATRNHAFVPPTAWVLNDGVLRLEDDKGPPREVLLATVRELRLEFAPTRPERNRFRCRLTLDNHRTLEFFNRTYAGVYEFHDTSAEYVAFVQELTAALVRHAPDCRFMAGASTALFWFNNSILVGVGIAVIAALFFFVSVGLFWVVLIKLLLVAFYTPVAIKWVRKNKPRVFAPDAIPRELLPAGQSSQEAPGKLR